MTMGDTTGMLLLLVLMPMWLELARWAVGDAGDAARAIAETDSPRSGDKGATRAFVGRRPPMTVRGMRSTPLLNANGGRADEARGSRVIRGASSSSESGRC